MLTFWTQVSTLRHQQGIMSAIGKLLQEDERVLFCGTPCQVAALLSFLKETNPTPHWHQQLLCLDFICHGVPSPEVFKQYRLEISRKYQAELEKISFRDKNAGWNNYSVCFTFADGSCYRQLSNDNQYMQGFLSELYNRPSCHQCQFRHLRSGADLTLGDYWGVEKTFPELNDDLGTSVMMINTNEGKEVWGKICDQVKFACESTFADVVAKNSALVDNPAIHNKRNAFFKKLNSSHSVTQLIQSCLRPGKIDQMKNIARRQKQRARKILNIIKRLIIQNE